jgi:hypothetical protein
VLGEQFQRSGDLRAQPMRDLAGPSL